MGRDLTVEFCDKHIEEQTIYMDQIRHKDLSNARKQEILISAAQVLLYFKSQKRKILKYQLPKEKTEMDKLKEIVGDESFTLVAAFLGSILLLKIIVIYCLWKI